MSWGGSQQPAWDPQQPQQPHQQHQQQYGESQGYGQQSSPNYYQQQPQGYQQPGYMPMHPAYAQQQPAHHVQEHHYEQRIPQQGPAGYNPYPAGGDAFMTGFATDMLQQQSATYIQRGQAFMQQRMGFLSTDVMHYFFNLNSEYVRHKLLMLVAPFLRRWDYSRVMEQISGGHKYLPPRQDVNAPDLYIPMMAAATYCLLMCLEAASRRSFKPELMTSAVSSASFAWVAHAVVLKVLLHLMGMAAAVPFLEVLAYAGYMFVHVCISTVFGAAFGRATWYVFWGYGSLCMAIFTVRVIKRIIFHEARQYRVNTSSHNYLLLGVALFQFPLLYFLGIRPAAVIGAVKQAASAAGKAALKSTLKA